MIIVGKECENCVYCEIIENNKADVRVHCDARDKLYRWGQCIPCEDKVKRKIEEDSEE